MTELSTQCHQPQNTRQSFDVSRPVSFKDSRYPEAIGAWVAETEFSLAPPIQELVERNLQASQLAYCDFPSRSTIISATQRWLQCQFDWEVPAHLIAYVGDIIAGYESVIRMLVPADAPIVVPTPAYPPLFNTPNYFGRRVIKIPCIQDSVSGRFILDYAEIDAALTTGALFVLTNPFNPTGQVFTREELLRLAELIERNDALVFSDEVHCPLVLNRSLQHLPYATLDEVTQRHTVSAYSASKAFNIAGLKCAQLVFGSPELARAWRVAAPFYADGATRLGLLANIAAYTDPACKQWLEGTLDTLRENLALVQQRLGGYAPQIKLARHDATYLLWIDVRGLAEEGLSTGSLPTDGSPSKERMADFLLREARVAVNDGGDYGVSGFIRLNFALQREQLEEALNRICVAFDRPAR